jgi:hypothetical protein
MSAFIFPVDAGAAGALDGDVFGLVEEAAGDALGHEPSAARFPLSQGRL